MPETVEQPTQLAAAKSAPAPELTNLGREIAQWVADLRGWKREVANTCGRGDPSADELDAMFKRFLAEQGLLSPNARPPPSPAQGQSAAPASATSSQSPCRLKCIEHVSGVNRLPPGTVLQVGTDTNMTIVYGPNGAGKSGFFRILKASCFTRTSGERTVLGDVWAPAPVEKRAVVTVTKEDGSELPVRWEEGSHDALLSERVAVFDSTSVRAHLDEKNSLAFAPAGLELFTRMATAYGQLKARLEREVQQRTPSLKPPPLEGNSRVAELLATVGATSPVDEIERLAVFGVTEARELETVEKELHEIVRLTPSEARARAETTLKRLGAIKEALERTPMALSDALVARLRAARDAVAGLECQAEIATAAQFSEEPIQPVGTRAWLELIASATQYASEAYPGSSYPSGRDEERCVLCQQTLSPDAADRMKRFWSMTETRLGQEIEQAKRETQQLLSAFSRVDLTPLAPESAAMTELDSAGDLKARVAVLHAALQQRKEAIARGDADLPTGALSASVVIDEVSRLMVQASGDLERYASDTAEQARRVAAMREMRTVLQHRRALAAVIADVKTAVQDHQWVAAATKAMPSLRTNEISTKQRVLMEQLLKSDYAKRLLDECKELGFALPIEIHLAGVAGQTVRTVHLAGAGVKVTPTQVLSEGEQRALALADFLTEATVASEFDCLVFDDPVTSHDHQRKQRVADRLVRESKERQVVVFTHDRVFIALLLAAAKQHCTTVACRTIGRRAIDDAPGFPQVDVFPEPSFEEQAITDAERILQDAKQSEGQELRDKILLGFGRLRTAYEEFIQHQFFAGVVNRWVEQVRWMNLTKVFFDPESMRTVQGRLEALSRYIDAHSHSDPFEEAPPTAADLEREIGAFRATEKNFKVKKKEFTAAAPKAILS